jgi:hypothetical protein
MSDLAHLIDTLETHLPALRQEMAGAEWAAFTAQLAEAAPYFARAAEDPAARLEALYRLERACGAFPATRRIFPPPGGQLVQPGPAPTPDEPTAGLSQGPLAQKEPDIPALMARAQALCQAPDAVADRLEATPPPAQD